MLMIHVNFTTSRAMHLIMLSIVRLKLEVEVGLGTTAAAAPETPLFYASATPTLPFVLIATDARPLHNGELPEACDRLVLGPDSYLPFHGTDG